MLNVLMVSGHESSALPEQQHHSTGCIRPEAELCIHQSIHERMARLVKVYNLKGQATCTRNRLAWGMSCTALDRAQPHAVHLLIDNLMPTGDLQSGFGKLLLTGCRQWWVLPPFYIQCLVDSGKLQRG